VRSASPQRPSCQARLRAISGTADVAAAPPGFTPSGDSAAVIGACPRPVAVAPATMVVPRIAAD